MHTLSLIVPAPPKFPATDVQEARWRSVVHTIAESAYMGFDVTDGAIVEHVCRRFEQATGMTPHPVLADEMAATVRACVEANKAAQAPEVRQ